ncbi:hypothetical protein K0M31_003533 [Melipona bicolor]|uniref:Uncharacterized protein n=1 Tax=Melipona bicolor TaxID=60889 RepID=A0AA40FZ58_9HYME|nr:hypothetical protein K0M31_003533 [Melipona bicolor]
MFAAIIRHFTMESVGGSKRNIVSEVIKSVEIPLLKHKKCGTRKNQLSYCEENILRDCDSQGCGGYLCCILSEQRFMRIERSYKRVPAC